MPLPSASLKNASATFSKPQPSSFFRPAVTADFYRWSSCQSAAMTMLIHGCGCALNKIALRRHFRVGKKTRFHCHHVITHGEICWLV